MERELFITQYQMRTDKIIVYQQYQGNKKNKGWNPKAKDELREVRKSAYSGKLTKGAKKRLERALTIMTYSCPVRYIYNPVIKKKVKFQVGFITLTISENRRNLTASESYKLLLRPFLQWATKYKGLRLYIWKAELQERGQIHYHIAVSNFIHYREIRDKWNYLQKKNGLLDDYYERYGNYDPNSTDVHQMYKIKNTTNYMLKYMTKDMEKEETKDQNTDKKEITYKGKVWDCSKILKDSNYFTEEKNPTIEQEIYKKEKANEVTILHEERFSIVYFRKGKPQDVLPLTSLFKMKQYYAMIWNNARDYEMNQRVKEAA